MVKRDSALERHSCWDVLFKGWCFVYGCGVRRLRRRNDLSSARQLHHHMHYIRFVKQPRLCVERGKTLLKFLFTIQTDLGDAFYPCDVELTICLRLASSAGVILLAESASWKSSSREVPFSVPIHKLKALSNAHLVVSVTPAESPTVLVRDGLPHGAIMALPPLLGCESLLHGLDSDPREPEIWRVLAGLADNDFAVREDVSETIASHVWDAGVGAVACIHLLLKSLREPRSRRKPVSSDPTLPLLREIISRSKVRVLELGTGVGLLGCFLARSIPGARVTLSDLAEARECVERNARSSCKSGPPAEFQPLDWTEPLPSALRAESFDLVVASDCIYNPDFSPALAKTMEELATLSPETKFLIAAKTRHDTEAVFFDEVAKSRFTIAEHEKILSPMDHSDEGLKDAETIHIYLFERAKLSR